MKSFGYFLITLVAKCNNITESSHNVSVVVYIIKQKIKVLLGMHT